MSQDTTLSNLTAAKIYQVDESGVANGILVPCMFNPFEYTVSKSNSYEKVKGNGKSMELKESSPQTLKLNLIFDTYLTAAPDKKDVSLTTRKLWQLMEPHKENDKKNKTKEKAPYVAFEWGVFCFVSLITSMSQKFILFDHHGVPVRAKVDITFTQFDDKPDYQNPTSGGILIEKIYTVSGTERLDNIAYEMYGNAGKWRDIAEYNQINNPFSLQAGQLITIPQL